MAAGDLIFGTLTICDVNTGVGTDGLKGSYNLASRNKAQAEYAEVVYANTTGRTLQQVGNANSSATNEGLVFTGVIYKATRAAMQTFLDSINTQRQNAALAFGTLQWLDGSLTQMFWTSFQPGGVRTTSGGVVRMRFVATFEQFPQ